MARLDNSPAFQRWAYVRKCTSPARDERLLHCSAEILPSLSGLGVDVISKGDIERCAVFRHQCHSERTCLPAESRTGSCRAISLCVNAYWLLFSRVR